MKTYTVTWTVAANNALVRLWNDNPAVRSAITTAADQIDAILRMRPNDLGEPTSPRHRQAVVYPLKVLFTVSDEDRYVRVIYVKYWYD